MEGLKKMDDFSDDDINPNIPLSLNKFEDLN